MVSKANLKLIRDELWRRGVIAEHYLRPHQLKLYNLIKVTAKEIIVPNISRRFGKTTTCVVYAMEECLKKKQNVRYATAFLSDLQEFLKPICDSVLATCPEDIRPTWAESKKSYVFPNGSVLKLIGVDKNPNALRGNAVDLLIMDEAAFISNLKNLYLDIIVPATLERDFKLMFPSTPPKESDHYWLTLMTKAKKAGTYIEQTIDDNTGLSEAEKERVLEELGGRDSESSQREFFCKIIKDSKTTVIPEFDPDKHVGQLSTPLYLYPQTTIDIGGSTDKTGVVLHYYDFETAKTKIVASKLIPENTGTEEIVNIVKGLESKFFPNMQISRVMDCPGITRVDFSKAGLPTRPPRKEKGSVEANINQLRLAFQRFEIEIESENNVMLIETLDKGQWQSNGKDFRRTDELGHLDLIAALSYGYREQNKNNPFPKDYGLSTTGRYKQPEKRNKKKNWLRETEDW